MKRSESGYTLIELMIGVLVGLIVLSGVIYVLLITLSSSRDVLTSTRLNQDVSNLGEEIAGELRRSGYWYVSAASAAAGASTASPYVSGGLDDFEIVPADQCILYSYDRNGDMSVTDNERFGFKRETKNNSDGKLVGVIRFRQSSSSMTDCSDGAGSWADMTDPNFMDVTSFAVTNLTECLSAASAATVNCTTTTNPYIGIRAVEIKLRAEAVKDTNWQASFDEIVRLRNNAVVTP